MATLDLRNHWTDKPEWDSGRRLWAFYLTFHGQSALHDRVRHDQAALAVVPGFDMIESANLHLSVQGIAFVDQVAAAQVGELAAIVGAAIRGQSFPTLHAHRAQVDFDAISLPVFPVQEIEGLKKVVHDAAADLLGPEGLYRLPESPGGFSPHISIAYANTEITPAAISAGMGQVSQELTPITPEGLSLLALKRENHTWTWDHERLLPFAV